jgi:Ca2+-binding EF-hand superfamily protein
MFDKDNSGSISKEEIKQVLGFGQSVASDEISKVMSQVDDDGNGQISFAEFEKMM